MVRYRLMQVQGELEEGNLECNMGGGLKGFRGLRFRRWIELGFGAKGLGDEWSWVLGRRGWGLNRIGFWGEGVRV